VNQRRVERLIAGHPGVREVYVYGTVHSGEEQVCAAVVLAPGTSIQDIAGFCREQGLRGYEVPHRFHVMDRLPRSPMGKVDRQRVVAAARDGGGGNGQRVAVVGLGYVGLTLAVSLARAGASVVGVEADPRVREALAARRPQLYEPGIAELLRELPAERLTVTDVLPETPLHAVVICVGTAVDPRTRRPDLRHLRAAVTGVAERIAPDTLVVVRSTVPVGTSRQLVYEKLAERIARPLLAFCPERTIQGRALTELAALPQVIGGIDERSVRRAQELFAPVAADQVCVSTVECAELVKLACNSHTDLIYGFGNELAMLSEALGVDGNEVIAAANLRYPRPDLCRPGYVGGSCLTKDPYLLIHAAEEAGYHPRMVSAARRVNERVPLVAVDQVLKALAALGRPAGDAKVLVCGIAYKGSPVTDDVRGSAAVEVARALRHRVGALAGHDYVVDPAAVEAVGYSPGTLVDGLRGADALVLLVDHPRYPEELTAALVRGNMRLPAIVFDMWGVLAPELSGHPDVEYRRLGRG
jgi:UDP-N-acetyl-D-mannosaminuronic acid dehydrogenase